MKANVRQLSPMLIINADDYGRSPAATDAALGLHAQRRLSSVSAMVFMKDSARAAARAATDALSVGLHINLSEAFTGPTVPEHLRAAHERIRRALTRNKYALVLYYPGLRCDFEAVIAAQLAEFTRLYQRAPSHFDGHQHMHLATNVLVQQLLPAGAIVRRSFSFDRNEKGAINRWYRRQVDRRLAARHRISDHLFCLGQHLSRERFAAMIRLAQDKAVEVMTHPERPGEYAALLSDEYAALLSKVAFATRRVV